MHIRHRSESVYADVLFYGIEEQPQPHVLNEFSFTFIKGLEQRKRTLYQTLNMDLLTRQGLFYASTADLDVTFSRES